MNRRELEHLPFREWSLRRLVLAAAGLAAFVVGLLRFDVNLAVAVFGLFLMGTASRMR